MNDISIIILAGGVGSRFWPFKNKLFSQFLGKPLLYYRLKQLYKFGLTNILIVCNNENFNLFTNFRNDYPEFKFDVVKQTINKGMAGAILSVFDKINDKNILVLKPLDIYEDILLQQFIKNIKSYKGNLLTGINISSYFPGGYLTIEDGYLKKIIEKPEIGSEPSSVVRLVFDYFTDTSVFLKILAETVSAKDDIYEKAITRMVEQKYKFKVIEYKGYWGYIQYPWHILSVSSHFLSKLKGQKRNNNNISDTATIIGDVQIEEGVRILENAKIIGPTYIGRNTLIGNNSIIRESTIGENCVIGFSTEVTRSFIGNNCWFHTNYIGDSVIGDNVGMGAGAVLANFRLDEKEIYSYVGKEKVNTFRTKLGAMIGENVRLGVNSAVMPGVKIGRDSFVGAAVILDKDLIEHKICLAKATYQISENKVNLKAGSRNKLKDKLIV